MLKGKIDEEGYLNIVRGKEYKEQLCPLPQFADFDVKYCGDWCPQFGEPLRMQIQSTIDMIKQSVDLRICQNRILYFYEFIDERPKE